MPDLYIVWKLGQLSLRYLALLLLFCFAVNMFAPCSLWHGCSEGAHEVQVTCGCVWGEGEKSSWGGV